MMMMCGPISNNRLSTNGKLLNSVEAQTVEGSELPYGGFIGMGVGKVEVNAVQIGQRPLCSEE